MSERNVMTHAELHAAGIPHEHLAENKKQFEYEHEMDHVHSKAGSGAGSNDRKAITNRLSKAIGHLEAVKRMVERGDDYGDILIQLSAVRSAVNNTGKVVLKNHLSDCITDAMEDDDAQAIERLNKAIDMFVK